MLDDHRLAGRHVAPTVAKSAVAGNWPRKEGVAIIHLNCESATPPGGSGLDHSDFLAVTQNTASTPESDWYTAVRKGDLDWYPKG